jgi:hypothetical protein
MSYIVNKLVIADIHSDRIPEDVVELFRTQMNWEDCLDREHICNIEEVDETSYFNRLTEESKAIVLEIQKEVAESGASYIRLII